LKRKRKWIKEYRCNLFGVNILERLVFCKHKCEDKKCLECDHRGNEDGLKDNNHDN